MNIQTKLKIYFHDIRKSWIAWSAAIFTGLEALATQSEYIKDIVGDKWYPFIMITVFMIARFRPSKVLPPKSER